MQMVNYPGNEKKGYSLLIEGKQLPYKSRLKKTLGRKKRSETPKIRNCL